MAVHEERHQQMTARKAPAPVGNLAESRTAQAALKQATAEAKTRHPAGKAQPAAKKAPAKAESRNTRHAEVEKLTYAATGRGGVTRTQQSATPLVVAIDVKIAGRRGAHLAEGAIVSFYASAEKAQAAVDKINAAGGDWSDAKVVKVTVVTEQVSA